VNGSELSAKKLVDLKRDILANPTLFVGREKIAFSSTPAFVDGRIEPRNVLFRSFLVGGKEGYKCIKNCFLN
jgi:uncharacterized circularly permuted ATP-grasp superfamily protein